MRIWLLGIIICAVALVTMRRSQPESVAPVAPVISISEPTKAQPSLPKTQAPERTPPPTVDPVAVFCAARNSDNRSDDLLEEARAIREALNGSLSAQALEMLDPQGPLFSKDPALQPSTDLGRLYHAFKIANFVRGRYSLPLNYDEAWRRFQALTSADISNVAYPYFKLIVERKSGMPIEKSRETIREIFRGRKWDTLYTEFLHEIDRLVVQSEDPLLYLKAQSFLGRFEIPDAFTEIRQLLANSIDEYIPLGDHVGRLMVRQGYEARDSHLIFGYNAIEYSIGQSMTLDQTPSYAELEVGKRGNQIWFDSMILDSDECNEAIYLKIKSQMREASIN